MFTWGSASCRRRQLRVGADVAGRGLGGVAAGGEAAAAKRPWRQEQAFGLSMMRGPPARLCASAMPTSACGAVRSFRRKAHHRYNRGMTQDLFRDDAYLRTPARPWCVRRRARHRAGPHGVLSAGRRPGRRRRRAGAGRRRHAASPTPARPRTPRASPPRHLARAGARPGGAAGRAAARRRVTAHDRLGAPPQADALPHHHPPAVPPGAAAGERLLDHARLRAAGLQHDRPARQGALTAGIARLVARRTRDGGRHHRRGARRQPVAGQEHVGAAAARHRAHPHHPHRRARATQIDFQPCGGTHVANTAEIGAWSSPRSRRRAPPPDGWCWASPERPELRPRPARTTHAAPPAFCACLAACLLAVGLCRCRRWRPGHRHGGHHPARAGRTAGACARRRGARQAPVWVGLQLAHQPEWHTYWKNAGDSGLPTQLQWTLPPGVSAGDIAWPVPKKIPSAPGQLRLRGHGAAAGAAHGRAVVQAGSLFAPDALDDQAQGRLAGVPQGMHPRGRRVHAQAAVRARPRCTAGLRRGLRRAAAAGAAGHRRRHPAQHRHGPGQGHRGARAGPAGRGARQAAGVLPRDPEVIETAGAWTQGLERRGVDRPRAAVAAAQRQPAADAGGAGRPATDGLARRTAGGRHLAGRRGAAAVSPALQAALRNANAAASAGRCGPGIGFSPRCSARCSAAWCSTSCPACSRCWPSRWWASRARRRPARHRVARARLHRRRRAVVPRAGRADAGRCAPPASNWAGASSCSRRWWWRRWRRCSRSSALNLAGLFEFGSLLPSSVCLAQVRHPVGNASSPACWRWPSPRPARRRSWAPRSAWPSPAGGAGAAGVRRLGIGMALPYLLASLVPAVARLAAAARRVDGTCSAS
jgi:hypothetical protein